jgi:type II secretory pathway predicted ATPase ExeA
MQNVNQYVDDGIIDNLKTNDHKYYRGGCWGRYLDIVPNLCRYSNDVVLINAVKGAGKTSLIEALIQDMSEDFKIACLKGNIKSTLEEVMKEIANSFSMSWDDSSDNTEANYDKRPWVLFVDDAHEYAKDIIDNLVELSLSDTDDVKLHLVLISTTDLNINEKKLKSNSTSKIHTLTLEPYTLEETEAFLWYQWHLAGNESKMPISGDTLTKLYKASGGIPEQIIILSKKAMAGEDIESVTPLAKKIDKKQVIVGAVLLGLFYYGTGFILDSSNEKRVKNINLLTGPVTNKKANGEDNKISTDAKKETKPKTEPVINTPKAAVEVSKDMPPKAIESKQPEIKKQSINVNNTPEASWKIFA